MITIGMIAAAAAAVLHSKVCYAEEKVADSGIFDGVTWRITTDRELVLGIPGETEEFEYRESRDRQSTPWCHSDIRSIKFEGTVWANGCTGYMFSGCESLRSIDFTGFNTSYATDMRCMFEGDSALKELDLLGFEVSRVNSMQDMFSGCTSLKSLRTGEKWKYGSLYDSQTCRPAFPVDMYDMVTKKEYKAGDYLPETGGRLFSRGKPAAAESKSTFKYFPTKEDYLAQCGFSAFEDIRQMLEEYMDDEAGGAIPGIITTTVNNGTKDEISKSFVPQGLCQFGEHFLVTAYERTKRGTDPKLSALFVLDSSWELVATVTVGRYTYHTGGIAYDEDGDVIWFCGKTGKSDDEAPYVYGLSGSTLRDAIESGGNHVHISRFTTDKLYVYNKTSCLDYYKGRLWVGTFNTEESQLIGYKTDGTALDRDDMVTVLGLDTAINGFTFGSDNDLYLSRSTGRNRKQTSKIVRKRIYGSFKKGSTLIVDNEYRAEVNVPKMNEEISIFGDNIYIMYESGARAYSDAHILTDRVVVLPLSLWDKTPKKKSGGEV